MKRPLVRTSSLRLLTFLDKSLDKILLIMRKLKMEIINVVSSYEKQIDWRSVAKQRRRPRWQWRRWRLQTNLIPQVPSSLAQLQGDNNQ